MHRYGRLEFLRYAFHLLGPTFKGPTEEEPLGSLPTPARTAFLNGAQNLFPDLRIELNSAPLTYGPSGGEIYQWTTAWSFPDPEFKTNLYQRLVTWRPLRRYASLADFLREHDLYGEEHYAERLFLERVFVPLFGVQGLGLLTPQAPFSDEAGRTRRADFLLTGMAPYAIEIEGRRYHDESGTGPRFTEEKQRQRGLALEKIAYFPIAFDDLKNSAEKALVALRELAERDLRLRAAIHNRGRRSDPDFEEWFLSFPARYHDYLKAAFYVLARALREGTETLNILDPHPGLPLAEIAFADAYFTLRETAKLHRLELSMPQVVLQVGGANNAHRSFAKAFRRLLPLWVGDTGGFRIQTGEPSSKEALVFDLDRIATMSREAERTYGEPPPAFRLEKAPERETLDFFARKFFAVPELKDAQLNLLSRVLRGESCLGILPTGYGKSLVFQLFSLLVPGVNIVISPLRALMRDQIYSLRRQGITGVESISSDDSASVKEAKTQWFLSGKLRILYLAPERLRIKDFFENLMCELGNLPISSITVDEAHCVSEWGHDFRPAYLHIGKFHHTVTKATKRPIPLIALTATASAAVRRDILRVLRLPDDAVEQLQSSDRPNLSLSVHAVGGEQTASKRESLRKLLTETLPKILGFQASDLLGLKDYDAYPSAGVIFAIYADPHSKNGLGEGVHSIARFLRKEIYKDDRKVWVYASRAPKVCPSCEAQEWVNQKGKKQCLVCKSTFAKPKYTTDRKWDEHMRRAQDQFQENRFPLLVATKGYGMGIDKRNIRFIIHHALASGLEGYYQEAGRAGRDGDHAHVALIYAPPNKACYENEIAKADRPPPCVVVGRAWFKPCPYGLAQPCDYARQASFVASQYPGVERSVDAVMRLVRKYRFQEAPEFTLKVPENQANDIEYALIRLHQLGILKDYTVSYLGKTHFFYLRLSNWNRQTLVESLTRHLKETRFADHEIDRRLKALQAASTPVEMIEAAVRALIERVYETVLPMRYQMLRNELEYAWSHEKNRCRRLVLRSIFDSEAYLPGDDYRCGFCDVCEPSLAFRAYGARVPERDVETEEIVRRLPRYLDHFDPEEAEILVRAAKRKQVARSLMLRAEHHLEREATNLGALYLAGALRAEEEPERSLEYLLRGFSEALHQGLEIASALSFIAEAAVLDADRALEKAWEEPALARYEARKALYLSLARRLDKHHPTVRLTRTFAEATLIREASEAIAKELRAARDELREAVKVLEEVA